MRVNETVSEGFPKAVASEVRVEMARQQISQSALAERLGWTQQRVSRRISGATPFDVAELEAVAGALGVPVLRLLPVSEVAR